MLELSDSVLAPHLSHRDRSLINLLSDVAVLVDIIKIEGPAQLLRHRTSKQHGQAQHKVLRK